MNFLVFFILGLIVGSFLNVVITRLSTLESILGRSFCRHCRKQIRWYDNVPLLSYIVLRGKCRDCEEGISWQYPAVELGTAVLFGLTGLVFFSPVFIATWIETFFVLGLIAFGVVIFVYDLKYMEIPMLVLWMGVIWTIVFLLVFDAGAMGLQMVLTHMTSLKLHSGMIAGLGAFLFFFFLAAISKEKWMGLGDAYVALWIGLALGVSWTFFSLILAFVVGAVWGVLLIIFSKRYGMKSRVPFAPFLIGTFLFAIFLQSQAQSDSFMQFLWNL